MNLNYRIPFKKLELWLSQALYIGVFVCLPLGCDAPPTLGVQGGETADADQHPANLPKRSLNESNMLDPARTIFPKSDGVYLLYAEGCPVTESLKEVLDDTLANDPSLPLNWLDWEATDFDVRQRLEIRGGTPWTIAVKGGEVVERQYGGHLNQNPNGKALNRTLLLHMLQRNGLADRQIENPRRRPPGVETGELFGLKSLEGKVFTLLDLRGGNFTGRSLRGAHFNASDLSNADLRNTDLTSAKLSHANLTGARMGDARLNDVVWNRTVCPDGFVTSIQGGSCDEHLQVSDDDAARIGLGQGSVNP